MKKSSSRPFLAHLGSGQEATFYLRVALCVNSNKTAILNFSATHYIPYQSSMSQLSDDMIRIQGKG